MNQDAANHMQQFDDFLLDHENQAAAWVTG